ncbi:MAG TPA: amine dehydrogenase large subunit [Candidatus Binatia bacterium]|nr:amine dehydrogenase large subunit [Candidatus Binatia bacterium]
MRRPAALTCLLRALTLSLALGAAGAAAETVGQVVTLPDKPGPHWFWLSDILLHRTALFDGDTGRLLGTITSGSAGVGFVVSPLFSPDHREVYLAETYYARGTRGERTDVVTVYDGTTLKPVEEIAIPPKRAEYFPGNAANALSDDGRFVAVFNLTPATSLSIVDVKARRFTAEVATPGCSLVYAAGARRFLMLCANGGLLSVVVDDDGRLTRLERSEPFFDPGKDPLTEKAVRRKNEWLFVSFDGVVHPVDVAGDAPKPGEKWPLVDDADKQASWRIGGAQHLAVHAASGRLYALMHQGVADTHKDAGTEIWVHDLASHRRLQRIPVVNPLASFVGLTLAAQKRERTARWSEWALERLVDNPGVDRILVTQDDHPVLIASASVPPALTIHDAMTGEVLRHVSEPGIAGSLLFAP